MVRCILALLTAGLFGSPQTFETWRHAQWLHSRTRLLENLTQPDATEGRVVASTSKKNPNYFFHWVRDAALVMNVVVDLFESETDAQQRAFYRDLLGDYIRVVREHQLTDNPSGSIHNGGLGEPLFKVDGSPRNEKWGRPQNDGPALRAFTLIRLAEILIQQGETSFVKKHLYSSKFPAASVIKSDLEYVASQWKEASFDLWEMDLGDHFYTRLTQRRALMAGSRLALKLGDQGAADYYYKQAKLLEKEIHKHWHPTRGYILSTLNKKHGVKKSDNLDIAVILGCLHTRDGDNFYGVTNTKMLSTLAHLINKFKAAYAINKVTVDKENNSLGPAIGRYVDDKYDGVGHTGGHAWVLATNAVAEYLYRLRRRWEVRQSITLNEGTLDLLRALDIELPVQRALEINGKDAEFNRLLELVGKKADAFLNRVRYHHHANGDLSEQIDRANGSMRGADNLTWSYASFITAVNARQINHN